MKTIEIKKLTLKNFKGCREFTVEFGKVTGIYGKNKLGKTTIFDAVIWVLFDKDSKNRTKFEIRPLDESNNIVPLLETSVQAILQVDGVLLELTKVLKDTDNKGKGALYYIDGFPVKQSEYKDKISSLLEEKLFKIISSPFYFSLNLSWEERRKVLLDATEDIPTERVIMANPSLKPMFTLLQQGNIDKLLKNIEAKVKKLVGDRKDIPTRIDELNKAISYMDFQAIATKKVELVQAIKTLEVSSKEGDKLYQLVSALSKLEFELRSEAKEPLIQLRIALKEKEMESSRLENQIYRVNSLLEINSEKVLSYGEELQQLRDKWNFVNGEVLELSPEDFCCPTCKRAFAKEGIESKKQELQENFKANKTKALKDINNLGATKRNDMEKLQVEINASQGELKALEDKLATLKAEILENRQEVDKCDPLADLSGNEEYKKLKEEVESLTAATSEEGSFLDKDANLKSLKKELEGVDSKLAFKEQNANIENRIVELRTKEREISEDISCLEGQTNLCEAFIKTKLELLTEKINNKFKFVKFKLMNTLINGNQEECCEALIEGVPFSNANTAAQINGGIDIINALSEYYQVSAPVFIDNRESINEIIPCNSQLINLIVSKDKTLVIKSEDNIKENVDKFSPAVTLEKIVEGPSF